MTSKMQAFLKLTVAALLSFAVAPLYAAAPVQKMGFTEPNQTPPFLMDKDMTRGAAGDGSLVFSLDLLFGANTPKTTSILPLIQYDSAKLDIIEIANVAQAGLVKPDPARLNEYKYRIAESSRNPAFADADMEFALAWIDLNEITAVSGATPEKPMRVATVKFRWRADATGDSQIAIIEAEAGVADEGFHGTNIFLQGPVQAEITARPKSIDATAGATEIRVKCALSRPVSTPVICALGGGSGAEPGGYTAPPAMNSTTIVIPEGKTWKSRTFHITPKASDAGKTLKIALRDASGANRAKIAHDPEPARILLTTPGLDVSKESITTREGGRDKKFKVRLTVPPSGGDVVVAISSTDTGEATVEPASLRFSAENWDEKREVTVKGADDRFDDGDKEYTINLVVDSANTGATRYHGITASVSGTTIDTDEAKPVLKASPIYLSETGGKQTVVITVELDDSVVFESDTRITLKNAGGTATEGADYRSFTLQDSIVIPAGAATASLTFAIRTKPDTSNDEKETILIAGEFDRPGVTADAVELTISEFNLNVDGNSGKDEKAVVNAQDGILIMRYLLGVRGDALTAGQTSATPETVAAHIEKCMGFLDVDNNGNVNQTDGTLIARYLLGLRGDDLFGGLPIPPAPILVPTVENNIAQLVP